MGPIQKLLCLSWWFIISFAFVYLCVYVILWKNTYFIHTISKDTHSGQNNMKKVQFRESQFTQDTKYINDFNFLNGKTGLRYICFFKNFDFSFWNNWWISYWGPIKAIIQGSVNSFLHHFLNISNLLWMGSTWAKMPYRSTPFHC